MSCPVRRMWVPSVRSEANASASAWPYSIGPSSSTSTRRISGLRSLRLIVKLSGTLSSSSLSERRRSSETAVSTSGLLVRSSSPVPTWVEVGSSNSPDSILRLSSLRVRWSSSRRSLAFGVHLLAGDHPLLDQLFRVDLGDRRVGLDPGGQHRLGVGGLVRLVVAVAAIPDQVDDHVAAPALAVSHRQADRRDRGLDVVGVDVDDRHVEALGEIAGVGGGACILGVGREAHLVVGDDVHGAAGRVAGERLKVERLGDDSLAGEGRIAVEQQRHRQGGLVVQAGSGAGGLRGASPPGHHRVHELEMARVRIQPHLDLVAVGGREQSPRRRSGT